uniref:Mitochondrial carrier protein n=1 Tax=Araucaria cunninghamii TaxID=56994 RepID=A0A0D6R6J5_ARACU
MSLRSSQQTAADIRLPADIDWEMLDKSKFFVLGAALFSGVSAALYPVVVLKTRQQVLPTHKSCLSVGTNILRHEGFPGMYRGFGTSLMGTIPARALYMSALEITKSNVGTTAIRLGFSEPVAAAVANAAAGLSASMAAQLVWTPVDVISQRLMVQGGQGMSQIATNYSGGIDAFRTIIKTDGLRGLYRGFGMSILTYAPSNALWWASYCMTQRMVWTGLGYCRNRDEHMKESFAPSSKMVVVVQGLSAAMAGGVSALVTTPLDTIKTRLQVLEGKENCRPTISQTVKTLLKEGGWTACYRGLGPRWATMSMSATTMITTYEFLKRMSTKPQQELCQKTP